MFHQASRSLIPTLLMMGRRCHSFRHEGIRHSSSFVRKSTGPFAKESHSSKTAIAAMICAAGGVIMAASTCTAINRHQNTRPTTTTTHMQGRFSFGSRHTSRPKTTKSSCPIPISRYGTKTRAYDLSTRRPGILDGICNPCDATCGDDSSSSSLCRH